MLNNGMLTSTSPEWYTPPALAAHVARFLGGIDLDPCAGPDRAIPARDHYTERGLDELWYGRVYCNPPYGREIGAWVEKAITSPCSQVVLLLPSRTGSAWFQKWIMPHCSICWVAGRLHFSGAKNSAPFDSVIAYKGWRHDAFARAFRSYGPVSIAPLVAAMWRAA